MAVEQQEAFHRLRACGLGCRKCSRAGVGTCRDLPRSRAGLVLRDVEVGTDEDALASGFALGMAMVTINTFDLKSNQQTSARLYKQTMALARSFATAIANQEYGSGSDLLSLRDRSELGTFLDFIDQQLALNDTPVFVMDDQFAVKEAAALIHKASTTDSTN